MKIDIDIITRHIKCYLEPYICSNQDELVIKDVFYLQNQISLNSIYFQNLKISLKEYQELPTKYKLAKKSSYKLGKFLVFSSSIDISDEEIDETLINAGFTYDALKKCNDFSKKTFINTYVQCLKDAIDKILIYSQISRPGALQLEKGEIFVNNKFVDQYNPLYSTIQEAYEYLEDDIYPELKFVPIEKIFSSLKETKIEINANPTCILEKAINCLSNTFNPSIGPNERLMYSIIGIENVYVSGGQAIQKQLNEKIQLFLGKLENQKKINNLYTIRSKFFHGEFPIKADNHTRSNECFDKDDLSLYGASCLSLLILIATIQKMILTKRKWIEFELKLV